MSYNVLPSNSDVYDFDNVLFKDAVSNEGITWEEPKMDTRAPISSDELRRQMNSMANDTDNATELKMFQGCMEDPMLGKSMCFLSDYEPVNYKFENRHVWANAVGDKVVVNKANSKNELESVNQDFARRGMEYLKATNEQLLVQPLCDVYDCENKPKDDPNCRVLNCMKCKKQ